MNVREGEFSGVLGMATGRYLASFWGACFLHRHGIVRFTSRNGVTSYTMWIFTKTAVCALCLTRTGFLSLPPHPGWGATSFCAVVNVGAHSWLVKWPKTTFIQKNCKGVLSLISVSRIRLNDIYSSTGIVSPIPCSKRFRQSCVLRIISGGFSHTYRASWYYQSLFVYQLMHNLIVLKTIL